MWATGVHVHALHSRLMALWLMWHRREGPCLGGTTRLLCQQDGHLTLAPRGTHDIERTRATLLARLLTEYISLCDFRQTRVMHAWSGSYNTNAVKTRTRFCRAAQRLCSGTGSSTHSTNIRLPGGSPESTIRFLVLPRALEAPAMGSHRDGRKPASLWMAFCLYVHKKGKIFISFPHLLS